MKLNLLVLMKVQLQYPGMLKLILVGFTILIICELSARFLSGTPRREKLPLLKVKPDSIHGYLPIPFNDHFSFDVKVKLNNLGLRGSDIFPSEYDNEYRIAILGESQVYGVGMPDSGLMTRHLQNQLFDQLSESRVRVINMGIRGYDIRQQHLFWKKYATRVSADYCIVVVTVYSLLYRNMARYYEIYNNYEWYFLDTGNQLAGSRVLFWHLAQIIRKSALLNTAYGIYKQYKERSGILGELLGYSGQNSKSQIITEFLAVVDDFKDYNKKAGIPFLLVLLPHSHQVSDWYKTKSFPNAIIPYLKRQEIAYLDLTPMLINEYQNEANLFIPFTAHYNEYSQKFIASQLSGYIKNRM